MVLLRPMLNFCWWPSNLLLSQGYLERKYPCRTKTIQWSSSSQCDDLSYVSIDYEFRPSRQLGIKFDATMDFNMVLSHALRDYLGCQLTYDTDILNAFSGVLQSFSRSLESTVVMGSIARILDWSLGFELSTRGDWRKEFPS